jgi:hypothetical protein
MRHFAGIWFAAAIHLEIGFSPGELVVIGSWAAKSLRPDGAADEFFFWNCVAPIWGTPTQFRNPNFTRREKPYGTKVPYKCVAKKANFSRFLG